MATRSTISVVVNKEDLGKNMKFDIAKLPEGKKYMDDNIGSIQSVTIDAPILSVYCHYDGYVSGVGETLVNEFNDYEKALNLVLGGDTSSLTGETLIQYCAWRNEEWAIVQPKMFSDDAFLLSEEYAYKFEGGEWYVKSVHGIDNWTLVKDCIENKAD